jgi:UDP-N-acetylglucosamine 2-epimerase
MEKREKHYDNYESMFGALKEMPEQITIQRKEQQEVHIVPKYLPMTVNETIIIETMERAKREKKWVLVFVIGTKPCYYKFYGSIMEAERQGTPYIIINSNQHYDENLSYGEKELNYTNKIGVNLSIRGNLAQKSAELFTKISWFANYLKQRWSDVTVTPVVLGDTILCGIVPAAWMFNREEKAIHNEAGLRSMTPECMHQADKLTTEEYVEQQFNGPWKLLMNEPFPEQWDSFVASKAAEFLFTPLELNRQHLLREGHPENKMWITGGVVVEALEKKKREKPTQSIFNVYPQLESEEWIRVDIHRKGNQTRQRFEAIVKGMQELLNKGHNVCFIEMNTTRLSLEKYNLRPVIDRMKQSKNFFHSEIWPEYANVLEFYQSKQCLAPLTDSGGVQEEMNLLDKPCFTARFNTDRPETVNEAHSNLLVPPISGEFMAKTVDYAIRNETLLQNMRNGKKLYGEKVAEKFITQMNKLMQEGRKPFSWAHDDIGYGK